MKELSFMMFDKYYAEQQEHVKNHKVEMVKVMPYRSPTFNSAVLLQNINDIPKMSDAEIRSFIDRHFDSILNAVFQGDREHVNCFRDIRFLDALTDVLIVKKFYENDVVVKLNNICYDYISLNNSMKDPNVVNKMIRISTIINKIDLPRLLGLGLNPNLASMLLISRYSTFDINVAIRRVNFIIVTQPTNVMTHDVIVEIFNTIYKEPEIWSRIFQYFMFDVIPEYNENDPNAAWVTADIEENNSEINLAILDILNKEPMKVIRGALLNYSESYSMLNYKKPIRFSLRKLSGDFDRIVDVANNMAIYEGICVP